VTFIGLISSLGCQSTGKVDQGVVAAADVLRPRVVEAIADGDHAVNVPDPVHQLMTDLAGLGLAGQGHDTVLDDHVERGRVGEEPAADDVLGDLLADLLI
jgi:hypothetical protein